MRFAGHPKQAARGQRRGQRRRHRRGYARGKQADAHAGPRPRAQPVGQHVAQRREREFANERRAHDQHGSGDEHPDRHCDCQAEAHVAQPLAARERRAQEQVVGDDSRPDEREHCQQRSGVVGETRFRHQAGDQGCDGRGQRHCDEQETRPHQRHECGHQARHELRRPRQQQRARGEREAQRHRAARRVERQHRPACPAEDIPGFIGRAAEQDRAADQGHRRQPRETGRVAALQHRRQIVACGHREPSGEFLQREGSNAREQDGPQQRRTKRGARAGRDGHRAGTDERSRDRGPQEDRAKTFHAQRLWRKRARAAIRRGAARFRTAPAPGIRGRRAPPGGTRSGRASSSAGDAHRIPPPTNRPASPA